MAGSSVRVVIGGFVALVALAGARLPAIAQQTPATQMPAYIDLQRDVVVNAELWTGSPEILTADFAFEGIMGIPGLQNAADLGLAVAAGAGVNLDWAQLAPEPPLRNLTSAASPLVIAAAGFGGAPLYRDAIPMVFSWPLLPSSVRPDTIAITLNTGAVVVPDVAALNPNYDLNERHVVVLFGEFGNRLAPGETGAIYPVSLEIVPGAGRLMAVGPDGPVDLTGLSRQPGNQYLTGPALVGAALSPFSPAGDFSPPNLSNAFPNDAYSLYGADAQYRLRLFTSGGFSTDGVSGILPTDFPQLFRLHAVDAQGNAVVIDRTGQVYDLGVGKVEVVGLAEVGAPQDAPLDRAYYVEDHDNYFDIVLKGDAAAIALLRSVEIPTSAEAGYLDLYNPGGPGRTPAAGTSYTKAALPQTYAIDMRLDDPGTVSYAAQALSAYDASDTLPIVFRMQDPAGPDRLTGSSNEAVALADAGMAFVAVDFANETARPGVTDVNAYAHAASGDRIYTADAAEQADLAADPGWIAEGRAFGAFDSRVPGTAPVYRFLDAATGWHLFTADLSDGLQGEGIAYQGVGWYSVLFQPPGGAGEETRFDRSDDLTLSDPIDLDGSLAKAGTGTLVLSSTARFGEGTTVSGGRLQVDGLLSGGAVEVQTGGTLSGSGIVAATTGIAGTLAPGNSPGLLTFAAPVTMAAGSTLAIEVDGTAAAAGAGGYDRVLVLGGGNSFTAGGTLAVQLRGISAPATNSYTPALGQRFANVVAAAGGIGGSFAALAQPSAGLAPGTRFDALYGSTAIDLVVTPAAYGNLPAAGVAQTANEAAVGAALDAVRPAAGVRPAGDAATLFPALAPLDGQGIRDALDSLSGRSHAESLAAAGDAHSLAGAAVAGRLSGRPAMAAGASGLAAGEGIEGGQTDGPAGWAEVLGGSGVQRSSGGVDGYDSHMRGIAVGADGRLPEGPLAGDLLLGAAIGRIATEAKGADGSTDIDSHFAAVYGSRDLAGLRLSGQLLAAYDSYDSRRTVAVGTLGASPSGSSHGWGLAGRVAVARPFRFGPSLSLTPNAGLRLGRAWRSAFDESDGGAVNLAVAAAAQTSLRSRLGVQLEHVQGPVTGSLSLGWSHEFLDEGAESEARLAGGAFTVASAPPGRDSLDAGAAVAIALGEAVTLEAGYRSSATRSSTAHAGTASLRITW